MKCYICAGNMEQIKTDLPFKLDEHQILVVKGLPVTQCSSCGEFLISDQVMESLDNLIVAMDKNAELEIKRYAA
jgi:YgiT-type zinc finger domain-containing protein